MDGWIGKHGRSMAGIDEKTQSLSLSGRIKMNHEQEEQDQPLR